MRRGEIITKNDIVALRPNHGIDAKDYDKIIEKTLKNSIKQYQKIDWEDIE